MPECMPDCLQQCIDQQQFALTNNHYQQQQQQLLQVEMMQRNAANSFVPTGDGQVTKSAMILSLIRKKKN